MLPFLVFLFLMAIPTNTLLLYAAAGVQGRNPDGKRLAAYGVVAGITLTFFRMVPPFGIHVPLQAAVLLYMTKRISGGRWSLSVLGVLMVELLSAVGEGVLAVPVLTMLGIPLVDVRTNMWVQLAGTWIGNTLLIAVCIYLGLRNQWRKVREQAE